MPPSNICDTSAFRIIYGSKGSNQFLQVASLQNDEAIGVGEMMSDNGDYDGWLLRTDTYGNVIWTKTYGNDKNDYFRKVIGTRDGGLLAVGAIENSDPTQPTGYAWAMKTDSRGNMLWSYRTNIKKSVMQQACQTSDGGFALVASVTLTGSATKIVVIKISASGGVEWMKEYSNGNTAYGYYIKQALDGRLLVSGFVYRMGAGRHDAFLMKLSPDDGSVLWLKTYGSAGNDVIDCFDEDPTGNLLLSLYWNDSGPTIVKTNADGEATWTKAYTLSIPVSRGNALKITPEGEIIVSLADASTHKGGAVMKTDKNGNPLWAYDYHPSGSSQYAQNSADRLISGRGFFISGYASRPGASTEGYLAKVDKNGHAGACQIKPVTVSAKNIEPIIQDHEWSDVSATVSWYADNISTSSPVITRTLICPQCCVSSNTTIDTSICQGQSYILPDSSKVNKSGIYAVKFTSSTGCDSIITTRLKVNPSYVDTVYDSICHHASYRLPDGRIVDTTGTFVSNLSTVKGCDSIITTHLSYRSFVYTQKFDSICEGTFYTLPNGRQVDSTGTFQVIVPSSTSCDTLASYHIVVKALPVINLGNDTCLIAGEHLLLNAGSGYPHYQWQDGSTSATLNVSYPGIYSIVVSNSCGIARDTIDVMAGCLPIIFVPSAFTPNDDGMNDVFHILNIHGQKVTSFDVYTRWGKRLFHTTNITDGWDGTYRGVPQGNGSYVYIIKLINLNGKRKVYKGTVVLIR